MTESFWIKVAKMDHSYIDKNIASVRKKIDEAAARAGRDPASITLLAAIKSADTEEIRHLYECCGVCVVGENRVQQLTERYDKLDTSKAQLHFIGSLQTNKVKYIIDKVSLIHSLDSERLAQEIQKQAQKRKITANVLVEINSGNEQSKGGIEPEAVADFCLSLKKYPNIKLCGFMTMAPRCECKEDYYPYFNNTRSIALSVWKNVLGREGEPVISMGMSESFEAAIECGSNMVRIGRCLFEQEQAQ